MDKGDIKEGLTFNHFIGINIPGPLACTIPTSAGLLAESASTSGIEAREAPVLLVLLPSVFHLKHCSLWDSVRECYYG